MACISPPPIPPLAPLAFLPLVLPPTRSLADLRRVDLFSGLQLDTSPEGLYYAYSSERMLCKSGLENRFLIAARKKSGDFTPARLHPKRVARARPGGELREGWKFFVSLSCATLDIKQYQVPSSEELFRARTRREKILQQFDNIACRVQRYRTVNSSRQTLSAQLAEKIIQ